MSLTNYVFLLFVAAACLDCTWAIIRQHLLHRETTALYTLTFVPIGTSLSLLICFVGYFILTFLSSHFSVIF
jgi:hypothetical protein